MSRDDNVMAVIVSKYLPKQLLFNFSPCILKFVHIFRRFTSSTIFIAKKFRASVLHNTHNIVKIQVLQVLIRSVSML